MTPNAKLVKLAHDYLALKRILVSGEEIRAVMQEIIRLADASVPPEALQSDDFLGSVIAYMEKRIAGFKARGDSIFNGSLVAEELQEWVNRLRSCAPSPLARSQEK